jgi:hypothetical protein
MAMERSRPLLNPCSTVAQSTAAQSLPNPCIHGGAHELLEGDAELVVGDAVGLVGIEVLRDMRERGGGWWAALPPTKSHPPPPAPSCASWGRAATSRLIEARSAGYWVRGPRSSGMRETGLMDETDPNHLMALQTRGG